MNYFLRLMSNQIKYIVCIMKYYIYLVTHDKNLLANNEDVYL